MVEKKNELAINAIKGDLDLKDFVDEQSKHISTN